MSFRAVAFLPVMPTLGPAAMSAVNQTPAANALASAYHGAAMALWAFQNGDRSVLERNRIALSDFKGAVKAALKSGLQKDQLILTRDGFLSLAFLDVWRQLIQGERTRKDLLEDSREAAEAILGRYAGERRKGDFIEPKRVDLVLQASGAVADLGASGTELLALAQPDGSTLLVSAKGYHPSYLGKVRGNRLVLRYFPMIDRPAEQFQGERQA